MLKIYAVTHKEVDEFAAERTPIGVGANKNIKDVEIYDDTGDNIAEKNKSFCELTALYWIWKNTNDEIVGFEHYRRFFAKENPFHYRPMRVSEMEKILRKKDVILPRKTKMDISFYEQYANDHYKSDMDICGEIIKDKYPEYYADYQAALNAHEGCIANIFVMRKELVDEYCQWIFTILFEAEKYIDYSNRDAYQQRVFGFLSERLFNVWIRHKNLKVKYVPRRSFGECSQWLRVVRRKLRKIKKN